MLEKQDAGNRVTLQTTLIEPAELVPEESDDSVSGGSDLDSWIRVPRMKARVKVRKRMAKIEIVTKRGLRTVVVLG